MNYLNIPLRYMKVCHIPINIKIMKKKIFKILLLYKVDIESSLSIQKNEIVSCSLHLLILI